VQRTALGEAVRVRGKTRSKKEPPPLHENSRPKKSKKRKRRRTGCRKKGLDLYWKGEKEENQLGGVFVAKLVGGGGPLKKKQTLAESERQSLGEGWAARPQKGGVYILWVAGGSVIDQTDEGWWKRGGAFNLKSEGGKEGRSTIASYV